MLCEISIRDDLQGDAPDAVRESKPRGFTSTVSVKLDKETGQLTGWDSLYHLMDASQVNKDDLINEDEVMNRLAPGAYTIKQGATSKEFVLRDN